MVLLVKNPPANAGNMRTNWIPGLGRSPGGGHGNPLQYSCLENPMDRGAWRATVHGVAKSQIWLSNWHIHSYPNFVILLDDNLCRQLISDLMMPWILLSRKTLVTKLLYLMETSQSLHTFFWVWHLTLLAIPSSESFLLHCSSYHCSLLGLLSLWISLPPLWAFFPGYLHLYYELCSLYVLVILQSSLIRLLCAYLWLISSTPMVSITINILMTPKYSSSAWLLPLSPGPIYTTVCWTFSLPYPPNSSTSIYSNWTHYLPLQASSNPVLLFLIDKYNYSYHNELLSSLFLSLFFKFNFYWSLRYMEKEISTHCSVLAWIIPGMGMPGGLLSMGSYRVGHDWSDGAAARYMQKNSKSSHNP